MASADKLEERAARHREKAERLAERAQIKREETPPLTPEKAERARRKALRRQANEPPVRPVLEEVGNAVTHGAGALLSLAGMILLLLRSDTVPKQISAWVYGGCLFLLFLMSCLYHAFPAGSTVKRLWRRFDYCSIYLLIGGTFTPLLLIYVGGPLGIGLCIGQWVIIVTGITLIGVFGPSVVRWLHFTLYFVIGWSALIFLPRMWREDSRLFGLILGGGVVYTLGIIPFAKKFRASHFIWHFFVLLGAILHYLAILLCVYGW